MKPLLAALVVMKTLLVALFVASLCPSASAATAEETLWTAAGFANPVITRVSLTRALDPKTTYTHRFEPTFVVFRGTGWTESEIETRAERTTHTYNQCGIAMPGYTLVVVDVPFGFIDVGWTDGRDRKIAEATPPTSHPLVYFARYDRDGDYAFTWRKSVTKVAALKNTTWMTRSLDEDTEFRNSVDPSYEVLAHELGHMIGDMGHVDDGTKGLMSEDGALLSDALSPELCARFRASDLLVPATSPTHP